MPTVFNSLRALRLLAFAGLVGLSCCPVLVSAEPLLYSAPQGTALAESVEQNTHRARSVLLDTQAFEAALRSDGDPVSLQLFDDVRVDLSFDRISSYGRTTTAFTGRLGDGQDPAEWYTLVRSGDAYMGHFWTGDGKVYKLRPLDEETGLHAVLELDSDGFEACLTCEEDHGSHVQPLPPAQVVQGARGCEDDGSVIDVLIVYTPAARNAAGGTNAIQALAISSIEASNQAYINSGIQTTLRLTLASEVNYSESGSFNSDLANLRDNIVPGVHELRDETKSDLVAMLTTSSGACGIGYLLQSLDPGFESLGFSVSNYSCAVGNLTFPHELGHNMGCQHDVDNAGSNPIFPYSFGWRWTTSGGQLRRSVMAYAPGSRVPYFSNPDVLNGGQPTGVESSAYNARTINNTAYLISNFRVSDCSQGPNDCGWSAVGDGVAGSALAMAQHNDGTGNALYVGGNFTGAAGVPTTGRIARWDGQQWSSVGGGINGTVHAIASVESGPLAGLYASGFFSSAGGVSVDNIARWDGQQWSPLGDGLNNRSYALTVFDDGSGEALYGAGVFTSSGGNPLSRIARWNGSEWQAVGGGVNGIVNALEVFDDGSGPALYAAGLITVAGGQTVEQITRWDGQSWSAVGALAPDDTINALEVFDDGSGEALYAAGRFATAGGESTPGIARWDGLNWTPVGDGLGPEVFALLSFRDADGPALFALGNFVVTIDFVPAIGIARWDGQQWDRMGLGVGGTGGRALTSATLGLGAALFVGGDFATAGSAQTSSVARWSCQSVFCPQDVDDDGEVSLGDLNLVLAGFGQQTPEGDTNGDGAVDLADLNAVLAAFGQTCP